MSTLKMWMCVIGIVGCFIAVGMIDHNALKVSEEIRREVEPAKAAGRVPFLKPNCPSGWVAHRSDGGDWITTCANAPLPMQHPLGKLAK